MDQGLSNSRFGLHSAAHALDVACAVDSAVSVRESIIEPGYFRYRSSGSCSRTDIRPPIEAEYRIYRFLSGPHVVASERFEGRSCPAIRSDSPRFGVLGSFNVKFKDTVKNGGAGKLPISIKLFVYSILDIRYRFA